MSTLSKMGRHALWVLPVVLVPIVFFASLPWLKTLGQTRALLVTAAVAMFVMGYAHYLGFRAQRGLDEVQKAGAAFAAQWGAPAGQAVFALLLLLPAFKDFTVGVVGRVAADPGVTLDGTVIIATLALGYCGLVLLQALGTMVVHAAWWTVKR